MTRNAFLPIRAFSKYVTAIIFAFSCAPHRTALAIESKQGIEIVDQSHDPLGTQLVFAVKECFRVSQTFEVTGPVGNRTQMVIATTQYDSNNSTRAIYSIIWLTPGDAKAPFSTYISNTLGYCQKDSVGETAKALVALTSKVLDGFTDALTKSLLKDFAAAPNTPDNPLLVTARIILEELRIIDGAVDEWAIMSNKNAGVLPSPKDIAPLCKARHCSKSLYASLQSNRCLDSLGNPILIPVVDGRPSLSHETFNRLSTVVPAEFWKPYTVN